MLERMSSITLPRSRPATLQEITIRRCTFSRRIMFGPSSRRTSASSRIGTWPDAGVSMGRSAIRSKSMLFERQVDDAWHSADRLLHSLAESSQRAEIVTENLDRDVGPRAGEHVIDSV